MTLYNTLSPYLLPLLSFYLVFITPQTAAFSHHAPPPPFGDKARLATGKRPSLHPLAINAISEALRQRCLSYTCSSSGNTHTEILKIDAEIDGITPLDVAMSAGRIVADALEKRKLACEADGSVQNDMFDVKECQTIAGRVVGVVTRLKNLEKMLIRKVHAVPWVKKYGEYTMFGVISMECKEIEGNVEGKKENMRVLLDDPLLRMSRAECLLALFLETVEKPKLEMVKETVPGGSECDFLDADRIEVLFQ